MDIESRINALDVQLERFESEPLIEECFEIGFFPWDNPKFLAFLHWTIQANLSTRSDSKFMRGLIYARHIEKIMPPDSDPEIYQDIRNWANLKLDRIMEHKPYSVWPAYFNRHFAYWFWPTSFTQGDAKLRLSLKIANAKIKMRKLGM